MDEPRPAWHKVPPRYPLIALLALFVIATLVALASRLLPGGLSTFVAGKLRGSGKGKAGQS
jgi:hypothetical protein